MARHPKLAHDGRRAKDGGSAWESNPASPNKRGATDFEDREGHRAPFTSEGIVLRIAECGLRTARVAEPRIMNSFESAIRNPQSAMSVRSALDQAHVARAGAFL